MIPHFSLIVPIYNTEAYLARCVQSILEQDFRDYELILVDDGSTDSSPSLCDTYAAQFSQVRVIHKANAGVSSARNVGIEMARGKWIWFIDSDDYILPHSLAELYHAQGEQEAQLYVFNERLAVQHSGTVDELLEKFYFNYVLGFGPCYKLYERSLIGNNLRFDVNETIGEDKLFNLEYYLHIRDVCFLGKQLYMCCRREGSATTTYSPDRHINQMRLFGKMRQKLDGHISSFNMGVLYFYQLIAGLKQSADGGLSWWKRIKLARQYRRDFPGDSRLYKQAFSRFLDYQNPSWLGRIWQHFMLGSF